MTEMTTQIGEMRYNAAEGQFEALVTFHTDAGRLRVASSFAAPVTTQPDAAERVLVSRALASLDQEGTLQARTMPLPSERVRRTRAAVAERRGLGWLSLFRAA
ncbi:hypothetical protein [Alloyangia pacifica]|uniref:hypothetical protein n=1 Tax=Alloyangia pacifica TaxID=311180 RepID=UPI001CD5EB88|nr:hypothetical protein [Alloyangia pacifica]MCA0997500.1 hypothetical protein [Alloyangia pacifica]